MPQAAFPLILDTTPPWLAFSPAPYVRSGGFYTLPFTVSEPATLHGVLVDSAGKSWPLYFDSGGGHLQVESHIAPGRADVVIDAVDDVLNAATYRVAVNVVSFAEVLYSDRPPINIDSANTSFGHVSSVVREGLSAEVSDREALVVEFHDRAFALFPVTNAEVP